MHHELHFIAVQAHCPAQGERKRLNGSSSQQSDCRRNSMTDDGRWGDQGSLCESELAVSKVPPGLQAAHSHSL